MKEREIFLALFREHAETHASVVSDLEEAERMVENWRTRAEKHYPYYNWNRSGVIFQGKIVKKGKSLPSP